MSHDALNPQQFGQKLCGVRAYVTDEDNLSHHVGTCSRPSGHKEKQHRSVSDEGVVSEWDHPR